MGRVRPNKTRRKNRDTKRAVKTKARTKDLDQIHVDLLPENAIKLKTQELDPDLPGLGQFYCIPCSRYFANEEALKDHCGRKLHKKRLKLLKEAPYTQQEAEAAAGLKTDNDRSLHARLRAAAETAMAM